MGYPRLTIDIDKIEHNARTMVRLCGEHGIAVTGVTKGACGQPDIAKAMLRGGVCSIGDSRMENVYRLKNAGVDTAFMLLRVPALSAVDEVVASVDVSLNSELSVLSALSQAGARLGRIHDVIVMVDLGDLREGVTPDDLVPFVKEALRLPNIRIVGLGTNLACFGGVVPSEDNMNGLVALADKIENTFGLTLQRISGVNSSGLDLLVSGRMPRKVNHARIGEAILLGRETVHRKPWPDTYQDAFTLYAEVLELKTKPSAPIGERSEDAFGRLPDFADRGNIARALLNVGREDVDVEGLAPCDPRLTILGGSSGYLVVDVSRTEERLRVGDVLAFSLDYAALLAAMTSPYVKKHPLQGGNPVDQTCRQTRDRKCRPTQAI